MPEGSGKPEGTSRPNLLVGWLLAEQRPSLLERLDRHFNVILFDLLAIRDSRVHFLDRPPDVSLLRFEYIHLFIPLLQDLSPDGSHVNHLVAFSDSSSPHSDRHDHLLGICSVIEEPNDDEHVTNALLEVLVKCPVHRPRTQPANSGNPIEEAIRDGFIDGFDTRILSLLAAGGTNEEIADALHYSQQTIRNRVSELLKVLDLRNRTELSTAWSQFLYSKALRSG